MANKDGRIRKNITLGATVQVVLKMDQTSNKLTKGEVEDILTSTAKHPHGIKVRLKSGQIGRVRKILSAKKGVAGENPAPVAKKPHLPWEPF